MSTLWSEVITDSALLFIDDIRLTEQLSTNPAQFFRRMTLYVNAALPMLSTPPELYQYLQTGLVLPDYADREWVSTDESITTPTTISTGKVGFDVFSCSVRRQDKFGDVIATPYADASYDPETGNVTFPAQTESGVEYEMDFYKDGYFVDLTPTMRRLLGLAIACVWDERFERNWLNIQMKIKDGSFDTVNESNYMEKANARKRENRQALSDELRKYDQDCAFYATVPKTNRSERLI